MTMHAEDLSPEIRRLEYIRKVEARRTLVARVVLFGTIVTLLMADLWITRQNHNDLLINLNQTRLAQVTLDEQAEARVAVLEEQIAHLQASVDGGAAEALATPEDIATSEATAQADEALAQVELYSD